MKGPTIVMWDEEDGEQECVIHNKVNLRQVTLHFGVDHRCHVTTIDENMKRKEEELLGLTLYRALKFVFEEKPAGSPA